MVQHAHQHGDFIGGAHLRQRQYGRAAYAIVRVRYQLRQGEDGIGAAYLPQCAGCRLPDARLYIVEQANDIAASIKQFCKILGLNLKKPADFEPVFKKKIDKLIKEREEARRDKDFKRSDSIRDELMNEGIIVEDTKEGPVWRRRL